MASFPPLRTHPSQPITSSAALSRLQTYLSASSLKENAYLLPNATITSTGPTAKSDASSNLTLHNLRRVEAGLRGEWLAPTLDLEEWSVPVAGGSEGASSVGQRERNGASGRNGEQADESGGWQDIEEYQREQTVENGEVGPENTEVGQEGEEMLDTEIEVVERVKKGAPVDKEAKRRAKKEKLRLEKKMRVLKSRKD